MKNTDLWTAKKDGLIILLLLIVIFSVFSNSLSNEFVYDDKEFIVENKTIRTFSPFSKFFLSKRSFSEKGTFVIYRPLPAISFAIDYALWGLKPSPFRITNILFHSLCAALLYGLTFVLTRQRFLSFFSAMAFGLHPVHTESVIWVAGRSNSFFMFFLLLSMIFYIRNRIKSKKYLSGYMYWLSLISYALALFSKESAVVTPLLILGYEIIYQKENIKKSLKNKKVLFFVHLGLFFVITLLYLLLRAHVLGKTAQIDRWGGGIAPTVYTMVQVVQEYIFLLIWPAALCVKRFYTVTFQFNAIVFFAILFHIFALGAAWKVSFKKPLISFGIIWFYLSLLPVLNIIPIKSLINDRFLYLPSIGFIWIIANIFWESRKRSPVKRYGKHILLILSFIIFFALGTRTVIRNRDWKNPFSLWTSTVKVSPQSPEPNINLGLLYMNKKNYKEAEKCFKIAMQNTLNPKNCDAHYNYGTMLLDMRRFKEAGKIFKQAVTRNPSYYKAYGNLGRVYLVFGEIDKAEKQFQKVLELNPGDKLAIDHLAIVDKIKKSSSLKRSNHKK